MLAVPLAVHLLVRYRARRVPFPSLRFLPVSRTSALRARIVSDWPLLVLRLLILAAAVAAFAAPVWISDARRTEWNARTARAIVVAADANADDPAVADEMRASLTAKTFAGPTVPDSLASAVSWLARQPPAAREIVIVGELRDGALSAADLDRVPPGVGIRFLPRGARSEEADVRLRNLADDADGRLREYDVQVSALIDETRVRYEPVAADPPRSIRVVAGTDAQPHADAVLRAVLRDGVLVGRHPDRTVIIGFAGADLGGEAALATPPSEWMRTALARVPEARGGERDGALVMLVPRPVTDPGAAAVVARAVRAAFADPLDPVEPRRIAAATLAEWSRPSGHSPPDAVPSDEGDRRAFWLLALVLMGVEQFTRRTRGVAVSAATRPAAPEADSTGGEARVA